MSSSKNSTKEPNKTPVYKKWWFWVIIVVVLCGIGAGASKSNEPQKVGDDSAMIRQSGNEQTDFKIGDIISYDGKEITVTAIERNISFDYSKPDAGNEYIRVSVKIENKSDDRISYNPFDWEIQSGNGDIKSIASVYYSADGALGSGELASGGKKTGDLYFEVPKDDTGLILHYKSSFWSDKTIEIKL